MILLPFVAFFIGIIAAMVGVGGGVFIVPLLTQVFGFTPVEAVGTSLATIVFTSLSSTVGYSRQKRIDYKIGAILTAATIPGAITGAITATIIKPRLLGLVFGFFLIFVASQMIFKLSFSRLLPTTAEKSWHRKILDSYGTVLEYKANVRLSFPLSFLGGFSSGLLGIGGGSLMVPIMHLTANFPIHIAVATSMFIMIFTSISGVATHFVRETNIHFDYVIFLALGVIFGAQIGAYLSKRTSGKNLKRIFGVVLLLVSIRMILKYI
jgi:hypothetical protein